MGVAVTKNDILDLLDSFETGQIKTIRSVWMVCVYTITYEDLLAIAIEYNKHKCMHALLDVFKVPTDNLTLKERIAYYQLGLTDTILFEQGV